MQDHSRFQKGLAAQLAPRPVHTPDINIEVDVDVNVDIDIDSAICVDVKHQRSTSSTLRSMFQLNIQFGQCLTAWAAWLEVLAAVQS